MPSQTDNDVQLLALAAGEIHGNFVRKWLALREQHGEDRGARGRSVLASLAEKEGWDERSTTLLTQITDSATSSGDFADRYATMTTACQTLLDLPEAPAAAKAIATIAQNSALRQSQLATDGEVLVHDVVGAIEGATVAAETLWWLGPEAPLIGAIVVGGLESAYAEWGR